MHALDIYVKQVQLPADITANSINCVVEGPEGFIWLGTTNGLYRWDGDRALKFETNQIAESLNITALTKDPEGTMWAGCEDGSIFQLQNNQLTEWKSADTMHFSRINTLLFDNSGNLWWGTNGSGLYFYNGRQINHIGVSDGLPDSYIYMLEKGFYGEVWASTDRGVALCKSWESLYEINSFDKASGLTDDIVRVLAKDKDDNMWLGFHEGGVCYYTNESKQFIEIPKENGNDFDQVNALAFDQSGLWVANGKNTIRYLNTSSENAVFEEVEMHGLSLPTKIEWIFTDHLGNLWMLDKEGLFVSSAGAFSLISHKFDTDISSARMLMNYSDTEIWLAKEHVISKVTSSGIRNYLSGVLSKSSTITSMKKDLYGNLWIGTFGDGVIVFHPQSGKYTLITEQDGLVNNSVLDLSIHGDEVWIATLGGASHISIENDWPTSPIAIESFDKEHGLGNNFIYNIHQDTDNATWFGTDGNGLVKYNENRFTFYDEQDGLLDNVVYSIAEDVEGTLWLSTASSGLYSFNGEHFMNYTVEDGLSSNQIYSLACKDDFVFIMNEGGLDILDRSNGIIMGLNQELGLKKIQADLNKVYIDNNCVCFMTRQGIIQINVKRLANYTTSPEMVLDQILVNLEPMDSAAFAVLDPDDNKLVFEYNGIWWMAPDKLHYMTRMIGYDSIWQTTYDRRATYASLSPGDYSFEVKAYLNSKSSTTAPLILNFRILKPLYARWWFIVLAILLVVAFFFWVVRYRELRLKTIEVRKKEKLEFEFQTLKNQINPHFLFNSFSTLISMIEDKTDLAAEYTEKLSDFFRDILEVKDQELIPMEEELTMMQNYSYIQHQRFADNFSLEIELDEPAKSSMLPPLTFQLLTENAIKHNIVSKNKPLLVSISSDNKFIFIANNLQKKPNPEHSTGIGLRNIQERYRLLTGKEVKVEEGEHFFKVILPIISTGE